MGDRKSTHCKTVNIKHSALFIYKRLEMQNGVNVAKFTG